MSQFQEIDQLPDNLIEYSIIDQRRLTERLIRNKWETGLQRYVGRSSFFDKNDFVRVISLMPQAFKGSREDLVKIKKGDESEIVDIIIPVSVIIRNLDEKTFFVTISFDSGSKVNSDSRAVYLGPITE
jgi:hypothetical protein